VPAFVAETAVVVRFAVVAGIRSLTPISSGFAGLSLFTFAIFDSVVLCFRAIAVRESPGFDGIAAQ